MKSVFMLNVIILSVVILNAIMISVVMLNVIILSVIILNVIILNVFMPNVVALLRAGWGDAWHPYLQGKSGIFSDVRSLPDLKFSRASWIPGRRTSRGSCASSPSWPTTFSSRWKYFKNFFPSSLMTRPKKIDGLPLETRHDRNPRFSKSLSHLEIYCSRLTPVISHLLIVNTMLPTS